MFSGARVDVRIWLCLGSPSPTSAETRHGEATK